MNLKGFWSYARSDDEAEGGRITQLARDVVAQFEMLTNEKVDLFLDSDSLVWGDTWQDQITSALGDTAFFVPVLTPRYFASQACRTELNVASRAADKYGIKQLIMPILYMDIDEIGKDDPEDDLVEIARAHQWVDFRQTGLLDRDSSGYRTVVRQMANRLAGANREAEVRAVSVSPNITEEVAEDDGFLEVLANFEAAAPRFVKIVEEITTEINKLEKVAVTAASEMESQASSASFARRLTITHKLAREMSPISDNINVLGEEFSKKLHDMDVGIRLLIGSGSSHFKTLEEHQEFGNMLEGMADSASAGLEPVFNLIEMATPLESMSRELRPVVRHLKRGLTLLGEGKDVITSWWHLYNAAPSEHVETVNPE